MTGVSQTGPRPRPRGRREGKKLLLRPAPPVVPRSGRRSHVRRRSVSAERLVIANHMLKIPQPLPDVKAKCKNFLRFLKIPRKPLGFPQMARRKPDAAGRNRAMAARIRYFAWEQDAGRALFCFPAGLLRRSPPMHPASALGALFTSGGRESVPQQGRFLRRKAAHSLPTFPPCGVRKTLFPASGRSRLGVRHSPCRRGPPLRKKGPCAFAHGPFGMRDTSGHCARSIRQTMAEICPRVMVLAGLKVLVPLEK